MGMYTEVFIRARLKDDTPVALVDWFDHLANGDNLIRPDEPDPWQPYDDHPFFDLKGDWQKMFCSGGAVYQISRRVQFYRARESYESHELICHASAKYVPVYEFVEWVRPWVEDHGFMGYSLYEGDEEPVLIYTSTRSHRIVVEGEVARSELELKERNNE